MTDSPFTPVAPKTAPNRKVKKKDEPESPAAKPIDTLRGRMQGYIEQIPELDTLFAIVSEAARSNRKIQVAGVECKKCGHKCNHYQWVEISDAKAAMEALKFLIEQAEGRPGTAEAATQQVLIKRIVVGVDE